MRRGRKHRFKRYSPRTRYRRFRKGKQPIALLPTLGFGAGLLTAQPFGTWASPMQGFMDGNMNIAIQSAIANLTGVGIGMPGTGVTTGIQVDYARILNPFDLSAAAGLKGLLWGSIGSMLASKIGINRYMKKVPYVGKYIKL